MSGRLRAASCPAFGASRHVASAVLTAMAFDPRVRSAMNIRYSKEIIATCKKLGLRIGFYDRKKEPEIPPLIAGTMTVKTVLMRDAPRPRAASTKVCKGKLEIDV